uniref:Uncharacterized protein n=1 Tax=Anopheles dirus TaxID=7168 RepID=A0A182NX06_9DIPT
MAAVQPAFPTAVPAAPTTSWPKGLGDGTVVQVSFSCFATLATSSTTRSGGRARPLLLSRRRGGVIESNSDPAKQWWAPALCHSRPVQSPHTSETVWSRSRPVVDHPELAPSSSNDPWR